MAKDLTKNLKKDTRKMMPEPEEKKTPAAVQPEEPKPEEKTAPAAEPEEPKQKKKGRPKIKTEKCKTINIAIPVSMLEKMEVAKLKYSNNLTAYVNAVIKSDLDTNYEQYLEIQRLING